MRARFPVEALEHLEIRINAHGAGFESHAVGSVSLGEEPCQFHAARCKVQGGGEASLSGHLRPVRVHPLDETIYFVSVKLRTKHTRKMGFSYFFFFLKTILLGNKAHHTQMMRESKLNQKCFI